MITVIDVCSRRELSFFFFVGFSDGDKGQAEISITKCGELFDNGIKPFEAIVGREFFLVLYFSFLIFLVFVLFFNQQRMRCVIKNNVKADSFEKEPGLINLFVF